MLDIGTEMLAHTSALNTADARGRNLAAVFGAVRENPGKSRSEIATDMPFSLQTMTNVVQELLDMGLVEEIERTGGRSRGNPHRGLRVVGQRSYGLGVQFRWNSVLLSVVDLDLHVADTSSRQIEVETSDVEGYLAALEEAIADYLATHREKDVWAIGLSGPLPIEVPNIPSHSLSGPTLWADQRWFREFFAGCTVARLKQRIETRFSLPVRVLNNPQAAGLAQSTSVPQGTRFAYVLAGLGLTACFVTDRALSQDIWRHGGEIGHIIYRGVTLSSVVSASGLRQSLQLELPQGCMEAELDRLAAAEPQLFEPWLNEASAILRFLTNFIEAALWPDGIALGGFIPVKLLDRLIEQASPLTDSVVMPDSDPRRSLPRLFRACHGAESIPYGAGVGVIGHRANPDFSRLITARRLS
jgi:predicted NBD/HSP70 family sugar kinase